MSERKHDYVPRNAAMFREFMEKLLPYVERDGFESATSPWRGTIPQERFTELTDSFEKFTDALEGANLDPTPANINRRREAQAATTALLRPFVNQYLRFPPVTNSDRIQMGIPNHDTIRTDHTAVTEIVDFLITPRAERELNIEFWIRDSGHKAKPQGYDGAVIIWGVQDARPEAPEELEHHTMASRMPFTLRFDEEERGKTAWVACCWQNERGITGAWSVYKSAVVP